MGYDYNYQRQRRQRTDARRRSRQQPPPRDPGFKPVSRIAITNLALGIVLGIAAGLLYAWVLAPVPTNNITPAMLSAEQQGDYVLLVAHHYNVDHDLGQARLNLDQLQFTNLNAVLAIQIENLIATGAPESDIRALVGLAAALGLNTDAMQPYLP